jgi:hypothetical protein
MKDGLSAAEKRRIGSYGALFVREAVRTDRLRTIKTVDAEGRVVREIDSADLAASMFKRAEIELSVFERPPDLKACRRCGKPVSKHTYWRALKDQRQKLCLACARRRKLPSDGRCVDCGKKASKAAVCRAWKGRKPIRCRVCAGIQRRARLLCCSSCGRAMSKQASRASNRRQAPRCQDCRTQPKVSCARCGAAVSRSTARRARAGRMVFCGSHDCRVASRGRVPETSDSGTPAGGK